MKITKETKDALADVLGNLKSWHHQCHAASITVVRSGILGPCRVARGGCPGVGSQHSWVVLGDDCYDQRALIVDPTLWSYRKDVEGIFIGRQNVYGHRPHGSGLIFEASQPSSFGGKPIWLKPPLSPEARVFLGILGPLDLRGWMTLANSPMGGWPSAEIISKMAEHPFLLATIPIDILGMVTDCNPHELYR